MVAVFVLCTSRINLSLRVYEMTCFAFLFALYASAFVECYGPSFALRLFLLA